MNLNHCTPGQRQAIETLDKPLMIVAGAGSGKTFTLTQRIVGALLPGKDGASFLDDIGQVLAITFTRKAAAELRDRIKEALFAEGLDEQALATDDAWISTIHGMAARILRENALELGLDPAFQVIEGTLENQLKDQAVLEAVDAVRNGQQPGLEPLIAAVPTRGFAGSSGLGDLAFKVLDRVRAMPGGFSGLVVPQPARTPQELMREMHGLAHAFQETAAAWPKVGKQDEACLNQLVDALQASERWLAQDAGAGFESSQFDEAAFCAAFYSFPPTSAKYHAKADDAEFFERWRQAYARAGQDAMAGLSLRLTLQLVRFAQLVEANYARLKGPSRLDNNDLLNMLAQALLENPKIQEWYRSKFKLIMVDEFQDTDRLQIQAIGALADPALGNLATVGDAQQSIYRFRGADVNVFLDFAARLEELPDPCFIELQNNFRSHRAVLTFVERVFEQPDGFGESFLNLQPKGAVNDKPDPIFDGGAYPRIQISDIRAETAIKDARLKAAEDIAEHFAQLRQSGAKASEMVVLLGGMSNAGLYLDALHARGFDAVVSGGSVFAQEPDVQTIASALRLAANPQADTLALYEVLAGAWFDLSDDVLLWLCRTVGEEGAMRSQSLSAGFFGGSAFEERLSADDARALELARNVVDRFLQQMRGLDKKQAVLDLALRSGRLTRLQARGANGQAAAGSLFKAATIVGQLAKECTGPSQLASSFSAYLESSKEAPGALSTTDADFVRIMTVHASKGLEFPHVAVAELRESSTPDALFAENAGEHSYVLFKRSLSDLPGKKTADALKKFVNVGSEQDSEGVPDKRLALVPDAPDLVTRIEAFRAEQERQESLRLLYVALTRASKSLFVCITRKGKTPKHAPGRASGLLQGALDWDAEDAGSVQLIDFGSDAPARVTVTVIGKDGCEAAAGLTSCDDEDARETDEPSVSNDVPLYPAFDDSTLKPNEGIRANVVAYSSLRHEKLAQTHVDETPEPIVPLFVEDDSDQPMVRRASDEDSATALGSAFHLLCQQAIERANAKRSAALHAPDDAAVARQIAKQRLTERQAARLRTALSRWFGSHACNELGKAAVRTAEVPFMLQLERGEGRAPLYLEGAIDALASDGPLSETDAQPHADGADSPGQTGPTSVCCACFYDYKTGGDEQEDAQLLHRKHLLQAQCYALALLEAGYDRVRGVFVRVEQADLDDLEQPQTVEYRFTSDEIPALRQAVLDALPKRLA